MKTFAVYAMALLAAVMPTASLAATPANETEAAYLQIGQDTVALINELTQVLNSVKDRESADAAVPRVQEVAAKLQSLRERAEALPAPGSDQEALFRENMNSAEVRAAIQNFMLSMLNLAQTDAYGSEELINALTRMVSGQL